MMWTRDRVRVLPATALLIAVLLWVTAPLSGQSGSKDGEWRYYGGDSGNTKYSPLDQINKDNLKDLQIVWRWKAENFGPRADHNFEATPIMIGGVLYTTAGSEAEYRQKADLWPLNSDGELIKQGFSVFRDGRD